MVTKIRRKLYKRGSSFETTIPIPVLFGVDISKNQEVNFEFNSEKKRWYLSFKEIQEKQQKL